MLKKGGTAMEPKYRVVLCVCVVVLIFGVVQTVAQRGKTCDHLDHPRHGKRLTFDNRPTGVTSFECDEGYSMRGHRKLVCLVSGQWRPKDPPTCYNNKESRDQPIISRQIESWIQPREDIFSYCKLGGNLEYLTLKCEQEVFLQMKEKIIDTDEPPEEKLLATAASAVAVGCIRTSSFLGQSLNIVTKTLHTCNSSIFEGPKENDIKPCDTKASEELIKFLSTDPMLTKSYYSVSAPIFFTLGCPILANSSVHRLYLDLKNVKGIDKSELVQAKHSSSKKDVLLMEYVYNHKSDADKIGLIKTLVEETSESMYEAPDINSSPFDTVFNTTNNDKRHKRTTRRISGDLEEYFSIQQSCLIELPLGVSIPSISESECLQLCLDETSCRSAGYSFNHSQCQLNTEIASEVGSLFSCQKENDDNEWEYFEKKPEVIYFIISRQEDGNVLQALDSMFVTTVTYQNDDSQFWFWKGDALYSKKYPTKALTVTNRLDNTSLIDSVDNTSLIDSDSISLNSYSDLKRQKWGFENNILQSHYDELTLNQTWSLQLDRIYFFITSRQSGKVLDASRADIDDVIIWSYHGGDNQLWFWDDDCIRSKAFPDKVLNLNMQEQLETGWGKVYLRPFNGGVNQRWTTEGDHIVSKYKSLRLQEKSGRCVLGYKQDGNLSQCWTFGTYRTYFFILNKNSGKVIAATSPFEIKQWHYSESKGQLWFWDDGVIRNYKYQDKVIDFDIDDVQQFGNGKLYLNSWENTVSQKWYYEDKYLLSAYQNLSVVVNENSVLNGVTINAQEGKHQKWSFNPTHDFFIITSRKTSKVLEVSIKSERDVSMWSYNGRDNQLWFWDENSLRSKMFPDKVLDLHMKDYLIDGWGKVYLHSYHGGNNQQWKRNGDHIVSNFNELSLDIRHGSSENGGWVGGNSETANLNQMWSFNLKERIYFTVKGKGSGKVLTVFNTGSVRLGSNDESDSQLWFWDETSIRSKKYQDKVVGIHISDFEKNGWGKINLQSYTGENNQKWRVDKEYIICDFSNLYLDVYHGLTKTGAIVGGYPGNFRENQKWSIEAYQDTCLDKTEKEIYEVVQWIPLVSTVWDLWSSVGYAAAGCTSVAKERAIGYGIGLVTDAASIATSGAASGLMQVAKTGVKVGIKVGLKHGINSGLKQGLKAGFVLTKTSIQQAATEAMTHLAENGFRRSFVRVLANSGKLYIKETITDAALLLKNVGIFSKQLLTHPIRTSAKTLTRASKQIDNLKLLIQNIKRRKGALNITHTGIRNVRCKRSIYTCNYLNRKRLSSKYAEAVNPNKLSQTTIETYSDRYLTMNTKMLDDIPQNMRNEKLNIQMKMETATSEIERAELLAVFSYTFTSEINVLTHYMIGGLPITKITAGYIATDGPKGLYQFALLQNYLKKQSLPIEQTVYRFEKGVMACHYKDGAHYTTKRFVSTTQDNKRIADAGINLESTSTYPVELTIHLKNSGVDISGLSAYPNQKEVLIPVGTQFDVKRKDINRDGVRIVQVTLTEASETSAPSNAIKRLCCGG